MNKYIYGNVAVASGHDCTAIICVNNGKEKHNFHKINYCSWLSDKFHSFVNR